MKLRTRPRTGATLLEFAFVAVIFFLLLFGIIEYSRLLFVREMMIQATREGCRYAVVNSNDDTVVADAQAIVLQKLSGVDKMLVEYKSSVFQSDINGNNTGTPGDAPFGAFICVSAEGKYHPILPQFLFMNSEMKLSFRTVMICEAN